MKSLFRRSVLTALVVSLFMTFAAVYAFAEPADPHDGAESISLGEAKTVEMVVKDTRYFKFTPVKSGYYTFRSLDDDQHDCDATLETWDESTKDYEDVASDGSNGPFNITFELEAQKEYFLRVFLYRSGTGETGEFKVEVNRETVQAISYVPVKPYQYDVYVDGSWNNKGRDKYFKYYAPDKKDGDKLILITDDGSVEYVYSENSREYVGKSGSIDTYKVSFRTNQEEKHWVVGKDNSMSVSYDSLYECSVPVEILPNTVTKVEFEPVNPYVFYVGSGTIASGINGSFEYFSSTEYNDGDKLKVTQNGKVKTYLFDDRYDAFVNIRDSKDSFDEDDLYRVWECQIDTHWRAGANNLLTVMYRGVECTTPVVVKDEEITGISYDPKDPFIYVEGVDGDWEGDKFSYSSPSKKSGDKLTVTRTGGSTEYIYKWYGYFVSTVGDTIWVNDVEFDYDTEAWSIGSNSMKVSFNKVSCFVPVKVVANTVTEISYEPADPYRYSTEDGLYGEYEVPDVLPGDKLTVVSGDVTKVYIAKIDSNMTEFSFVNQEDNNDTIPTSKVVFVSKQDEVPWEIGEENLIYVKYNNCTCSVGVTILDEGVARAEAVEKANKLLAEIDALDLSGLSSEVYEFVMEGVNYLKRLLEEGGKSSKIKGRAQELDYCLNILVKSDELARRSAEEEADHILRGVKELDPAYYSEDSYKAVIDAANKLQAILDSDSSTSKQIMDAVGVLEKALSGLVDEDDAKKDASKKANEAIKKTNSLKADDYTEESWKAVDKAKADLNKVLADPKSTSKDVNKALSALNSAVSGLKKKSTPVTPVKPDEEVEPAELKAQPMRVTAKKKSFKAKALKKSKKSYKAVIVKKAQGKVTYKIKGNKKAKKFLKFNKKNGKITVKKGTKKGKYVLKITVKALGNASYKAGTKTVKVVVRVK